MSTVAIRPKLRRNVIGSGLPWPALFLYGSLRDKERQPYTVLRAPERGGGGRKRFYLQTTLGASELHVHEASRRSARNEGFLREHSDGVTVLASPPGAEGQPFRFEVDATTSSWTEMGTMDLHGTLVASTKPRSETHD